jgi:hypothetical protein
MYALLRHDPDARAAIFVAVNASYRAHYQQWYRARHGHAPETVPDDDSIRRLLAPALHRYGLRLQARLERDASTSAERR